MSALSLSAIPAGCGLALTEASPLHRGGDRVHASERDPSIPLRESARVAFSAWGRPPAFVRGEPFEGQPGRIVPSGRLPEERLAGDWPAFSGASAVDAAGFASGRRS